MSQDTPPTPTNLALGRRTQTPHTHFCPLLHEATGVGGAFPDVVWVEAPRCSPHALARPAPF